MKNKKIELSLRDMLNLCELGRICFTGEETLKAIRTTKSTPNHTKVIVFDEAFRGLASTSVLSKGKI